MELSKYSASDLGDVVYKIQRRQRRIAKLVETGAEDDAIQAIFEEIKQLKTKGHELVDLL